MRASLIAAIKTGSRRPQTEAREAEHGINNTRVARRHEFHPVAHRSCPRHRRDRGALHELDRSRHRIDHYRAPRRTRRVLDLPGTRSSNDLLTRARAWKRRVGVSAIWRSPASLRRAAGPSWSARRLRVQSHAKGCSAREMVSHDLLRGARPFRFTTQTAWAPRSTVAWAAFGA